jgi:Dolichyl-phosphate-mannose-protein mannosyltransferase
MSDAPMAAVPTLRTLKIVCGLVVACAVTLFLSRNLNANLWLDELLTLTLMQARSLPKLWAGITAGVDGNPPLYLTLAWLIAHVTPSGISPVAVLRLLNVLATIGAIAALYRVSTRVASTLASWIAVFLLAGLNDNVIFVALELRTYALYFLMAALAILLQQRLIERRRRIDLFALGLCYAALVQTHTFGIAYVVAIALAGWLSVLGRGWRDCRRLVWAAAPAIIVLACWSPFLLGQSQVARPYNWIGIPDATELVRSMFPSPAASWFAAVELYCIAGFAIWSARSHRWPGLRGLVLDDEWQPYRYAVLVVLGMLGVAASVWTLSQLVFPLFLSRYFTPQIAIGFALHVAFCELALHVARHRLQIAPGRLAAAAIIIPPLLFCVVLLAKDPGRAQIACADSTGTKDFEKDFVHGDLPVVAESPHVFMPRATYSSQHAAYRFPLDWDVVMNFRERSSGNATDFQLMTRLKSWANMASIMSTEDIIKAYPQFLAIELSGRAWFYNLRNTRDVQAEKLTEVFDGGGNSCTLWKVTSVKPRL